MTEILEILKSGPAASAVIVGVIAALLKSVKSIFEFNDDHLQKRQLRKLAFLAKECEKNDVLQQIVSTARDEEVFRNLFGRTASPENIGALTHLYKTGKFSLSELRVSSPYLILVDGSLVVDLGWQARITFCVSLILVIVMGLYVVALLWLLFSTPSAGAYLAVIVLMALYLLFAWFVGSDARAVLIAKRVQKKMLKTRMQPNSSFKLDA